MSSLNICQAKGSWTSKILHPRFPTKKLIKMAAFFQPSKRPAPWLQLSLESFPTPWRCRSVVGTAEAGPFRDHGRNGLFRRGDPAVLGRGMNEMGNQITFISPSKRHLINHFFEEASNISLFPRKKWYTQASPTAGVSSEMLHEAMLSWPRSGKRSLSKNQPKITLVVTSASWVGG